MKKLSILLVILCLLLPAAAMAANPTVEIGDVELPNGYYMASDTNVPVAEKPDGGYAYLKDGVLELNNYTYRLPYNPYEYHTNVLYIRGGDLDIFLIGENSLDEGSTSMKHGIYADAGALTISGPGSLRIYATHSISANTLLIDCGKLTSINWTGISASTLTINSDVEFRCAAYCFSANTININNATLQLSTGEDVGIICDQINIQGEDTVLELTGDDWSGDGIFTVHKKLNIVSPLQIKTPEGGYIDRVGSYYTIMEPNGVPAATIRIAKGIPTPPPSPTPAPVPQTGDHADLTLWLALAVLAITGMVLLRRRAHR